MAKTPIAVKDSGSDTKTIKSKTPEDIASSLLEKEVEAALKSDNLVEISKVQVKLLMSIANNLNKIDWKLWEFYTRLGK